MVFHGTPCAGRRAERRGSPYRAALRWSPGTTGAGRV